MVAEESTAWPLVTYPPEQGGLGFNLQVEHGLDERPAATIMKMDPYFRQFHHRDVTFSMIYAFSENFVLPLSHDEVVHMKGSLRSARCPATTGEQLAGVRAFLGLYAVPTPAKSCCSWAASCGQWHEWDFARPAGLVSAGRSRLPGQP